MGANQYTYDSPLPRAKTKVAYTPKEAVEVGRSLMMLKATCPHGDFSPRLKGLGYTNSDAERLMRMSREFHGASSKYLLKAVDSVSKLYELMALESDELTALKTGGEARGLTLRCLKDMTALQLRVAIRGESYLRVQASLTTDEERMLREYRKRTRAAEDVIDKNGPYLATKFDLFNSQVMGVE